jgi:excisionase family DNA binding protein
MTSLSLREAAEQAGTSKSTIRRPIKSGRMSATRTARTTPQTVEALYAIVISRDGLSAKRSSALSPRYSGSWQGRAGDNEVGDAAIRDS